MLSFETVLDLLVEKERARRDFYKEASLLFPSDSEICEVFQMLQEWEDRHVVSCEQFRRSMLESEERWSEDESRELAPVIAGIIQERFYRNVSKARIRETIQSAEDAVDYAILFEKDAILFFLELTDHVHATERNLLLRMIDDERQHIQHLVRLKARIGASQPESVFE